jgi:hypothetical protein
MARWADVEREAPELAARVREIFDANKHKTIATIRADGSPRISGIEAEFWEGDIWWGSMPGSRKGADLKRDPRFAMHSATVDPELTLGDAKIAGRVVLATADEFQRYATHVSETMEQVPEGEFDAFRADVTEVVVIRIGEPADHLLIEMWHEGKGARTIKRK